MYMYMYTGGCLMIGLGLGFILSYFLGWGIGLSAGTLIGLGVGLILEAIFTSKKGR